MKAYRLSVGLLIVSIFYSGVSAQNTTGTLTCKFCNRVLSLDGCSGSVKCSDQESCYMDEIITEQLTIVYSGGCRSKSVCSAGISGSPSVGRREMTRRESGDLIACSRCCDFKKHSGELDCNARLCGIKYLNTNTSRCYLCDSTASDSEQRDVEHPEDCLSETTCQPNEACGARRFVLASKDTYRYECTQKAYCSLLTQQALLRKDECITNPDPNLCGNHKRAAVEQCTACCGDGLCNSGTCEDVLDQLYKLWKGGVLDFKTLKKNTALTTIQPLPTKPATPVTTTAPPPPTRPTTDQPTTPPTVITTTPSTAAPIVTTTVATTQSTVATTQSTVATTQSTVATTVATAPPPTKPTTDQPTQPPTTLTVITTNPPIVTTTTAQQTVASSTDLPTPPPTITIVIPTSPSPDAPTASTTAAPAPTPIQASVVVQQSSAVPSSPAMNSTPVTMGTTTDNTTGIIG